MADSKLSALTELAVVPATDDELYIRDVSEVAASESKRITVANLITREFFIPCTAGTDSRTWPAAYLINAAADEASMQFDVPHDFSSVVEAVVLRAGGATATHRLNYTVQHAATGEIIDTHQEILQNQDTAETDLIYYEHDISSLLSALVAGDHVSIRVYGDAVNVPDDYIYGVRFKYS